MPVVYGFKSDKLKVTETIQEKHLCGASRARTYDDRIMSPGL